MLKSIGLEPKNRKRGSRIIYSFEQQVALLGLMQKDIQNVYENVKFY